MKKFCDVLRLICKVFISIVFVAGVSVEFAGVFCRYVLNNSIIWAEEFSRYTFNWVIMFACALAVSSNSHMNIDLIFRIIPKKYHRYYQMVIDLVVIGFLGFMIFQSIKLAAGVKIQISQAMRVPMSLVYSGMPIGFALMFIFAIERLLNDLRDRKEVPSQSADEKGDLPK